MSGMPSLRIVALAFLVTVAAIAFVVLGGSDDEASEEATEAPEGYVTYEGQFGTHGFLFAYPEEWGEVTQREGASENEAFFEIEGSAATDGSGAIKLGVQLDSASPEAILQANSGFAGLQGTGELEVSDPEEVDVIGAIEALRSDATYAAGAESDAASTAETSILVAGTADETIFNLIVSGGGETSVDIEAVLDSLEIFDSPEAPDA